MAFAILRVAKLKTAGNIGSSDAHTERTRETRNADPELTKENQYLRGEKGENLNEKIDGVLDELGIKPRANAVKCIEFLTGASPEYFTDAEKLNSFIEKNEEFLQQLEERGMRFVKSVVHLDESTPHIVSYGVPIDERGRLCARSYTGGREKLSGLQDQYAETLEPLGLERGIKGSTATHQDIKTYYGKIDRFDELQESEQEATKLLEQTTTELEKITAPDLPLRDAARAFFPTAETSQGMAVLGLDNAEEIQAIITPSNTAATLAGEVISDGSSVKFLQNLTNAEPDEILKTIADEFGDEAATNAARSYGEEISKNLLDSAKELEPEKVEIDAEAATAEVAEAAEATEVASLLIL